MNTRTLHLLFLWCAVCVAAPQPIAAQPNQPIQIDDPTLSIQWRPSAPGSIAKRDAGSFAQRYIGSDKQAQPQAPAAPQPPQSPTPPATPQAPAAPKEPGPLPQPDETPPPAAKQGDASGDEDASEASALTGSELLERQPLGKVSQPQEQDSTSERNDPLWRPGWLLNTITALGAVLAVIILLRVVLGRFTGAGGVVQSSPLLEVLSRVTVAPRSQVVLMRMGSRILVVGESAGGLRTLAQITEPDEIAQVLASVASDRPNSISRGFQQLVTRFNGEYEERDSHALEGGDTTEHHIDRARDQVSSLLARVRRISHQGGVA